MTAKTEVTIGDPALAFATGGQAVAFESGAPDATSTAAILTANPTIAAAFGASPTFFAIAELGGAYAKSGGTASQTTTETVNLTVDLTQLAARQDLMAGFYGAATRWASSASPAWSSPLTGDGAVLLTKTFASSGGGPELLQRQDPGSGFARPHWRSQRATPLTSFRPASPSPPPRRGKASTPR